jgi:methyl-accepting chemotaxis protein
MAQVDQVTQRNASAAEEISSTAEELASQSEALLEIMNYFKVSGGDSVAPFAAQRHSQDAWSESELPHPARSPLPAIKPNRKAEAEAASFSRF